MNVLPVIAREIREQSRRGGTYWLPVTGACVLLLVAFFHQLEQRWAGTDGQELFELLHTFLVFGIWGIVPMIAADCISNERRSGTLGLLFLTSLSILDVVVAKAAAVLLRSIKVLVAAVPVMTLAFLMGGVSWGGILLSLLIQLAALVWFVAIGILASSLCRKLSAVAVTVSVLTFVGGVMFVHMLGWIHMTRFSGFGMTDVGLGVWFEASINLLVSPQQMVLGVADIEHLGWFQLGWVVIGAMVLLLITAKVVRLNWREEPPSAGRMLLGKALVRPRFGAGILRDSLRGTLSRNPMAWLQRRNWKVRMVSWTWLLVLTTFYAWILSDWQFLGGWLDDFQYFFGTLLLICLWLVSSGSFSRERECGALELILVSPLSSRQLLGARLRGIWLQFLPVLLLIVLMWAFQFISEAFANVPRRYYYYGSSGWVERVDCGFLVLAYLTIPVIGLFWSMRVKHAFVALLFTGGTLFIPWLIFVFSYNATEFILNTGLLGIAPTYENYYWFSTITSRALPSAMLIVMAPWFWKRLVRFVEGRRFVTTPKR